MKHYVLLKLVPGADADRIFESMSETYQKLEAAMPQLHNPKVHKNCVVRDSNADIMAVIDLDGEEYLQPYLTHPLHLKMAQDMKDMLAGRTSFDHK